MKAVPLTDGSVWVQYHEPNSPFYDGVVLQFADPATPMKRATLTGTGPHTGEEPTPLLPPKATPKDEDQEDEPEEEVRSGRCLAKWLHKVWKMSRQMASKGFYVAIQGG